MVRETLKKSGNLERILKSEGMIGSNHDLERTTYIVKHRKMSEEFLLCAVILVTIYHIEVPVFLNMLSNVENFHSSRP